MCSPRVPAFAGMTATGDVAFFESGRRRQNTKLHRIYILLRIRKTRIGQQCAFAGMKALRVERRLWTSERPLTPTHKFNPKKTDGVG